MHRKAKAFKEGRTRHAIFNQMHRHLPKWCYAIDIDLLLLNGQKILAVLEYKPGGQDHITHMQCVAFNEFTEMGIPVYIIEGYQVEEGNFTIKKFKYAEYDENAGNYLIRTEYVTVVESWEEYANWEKEIRYELST